MTQIANLAPAPARSENVRPWTNSSTAPQRVSVLVVEDNKVEQVVLRAMLRKFGYRVYCADNGKRALSLLQCEPIDLVVSDWRMPELTGIDLCRQLRNNPALRQPYFILLTGSQTEADLVAGMDVGADDFIGKPCSSEELRVRLQAGARIMRLRAEAEYRNRQLAQSLDREAEAHHLIRRDLDAAARMQRHLLPANTNPFPGIEVGTLFLPAATVAGDSFNFFRIDEEHLAFYHIDVAGHGIAAAMLSFTVARFLSPEVGAIRLQDWRPGEPAASTGGLPANIIPPEDLVTILNQQFLDKEDDGNYFTIVYGILNTSNGVGRLCQAGHPHPLIISAEGTPRLLGEGGFPVGLFDEAHYESVSFQLAAGERLILYSDGIADCRNATGAPFTALRLAELLGANHHSNLSESIASLGEHLQRWRGDAALEDDISLLVLGCHSRA